MSKLLLVDDDTDLLSYVLEALTKDNYLCESVGLGGDALQLLGSFKYDLIILDWSLPDITGLEVCKEFRAQGGSTPILFLTGQTDISYRESGLDSGADDYLVKPFDIRELKARIRSILRRPTELFQTALTIGGVTLNAQERSLSSGEQNVRLMPRECAVLEYLMRHPNRTYSTKQLLDCVWPSDSDASEDTVRTCMKTLRHKLGKLNKESLVKTVLGAGYIVESESNKSESNKSESNKSESNKSESNN